MSTAEAQLAADLANAKFSTGPKTEEGKQRLSHNAIRHRLFTRISPTAVGFRSFLGEYTAQFQPKGKLEIDLVRNIADTQDA